MITKTLTEVLLQALQAAVEDINGPLVGKVTKYTATAPDVALVDVLPMVQLDFDGEATESPVLQSVPVSWPGGENYRITWPLTPDSDYVKLLPYGIDHSAWIASGAERQAPPSPRRFSMSDVVAEPIPPWSRAHPVPANSVASDGMVLFAPLIYFGGSDATKKVGLEGDNCPAGSLMATWMAQVETAINVLAPGSITPLSTVPGFADTVIATLTASAGAMKGK